MDYRINEKVSALDLSDLRQSIGWNRMESELKNPKLKDFLTIACYERFGFHTMLCGQMETYKGE
ncbi:hypothetical protein ACPWSR_05435 [Alloiococcus sp. CFN-8]|uniref:hypothetical protein n=1 Tax=Alloiococcus sp. CFN-8 TaxID=3416081 RepID=UPI003CF11954